MLEAIPFLSMRGQHDPMKDEILQAISRVYDRSWFVLGEEGVNFERQYAKFSGVKHCAGVANGLDAIYLSLKALGIGKGHEVIVPSNTCVPTWLAVSMAGATIVPVDPDPVTFNIDATGVEAALTSRTKAIIPVHLYGLACSMSALMKLAAKHDLFVVEDNAQGHGATHRGRMTGSFGHVNATSFYPTKNLGALGDAGAVTTNSKKLHSKVCTFRNYGSGKKYFNEVPGINSRLDELQAAILLVKLSKLKQWTKQRQELARYYDKLLAPLGSVVRPSVLEGSTHAYHLYVIRTDRRNGLQKYLQKKNIGTLVHYPVPPHLQKAYQSLKLKRGRFPVAETIANTCLSLPLWPGMKPEAVERVVENISSFYDGK